MRVKFGIYWDADLVPHCPACAAPLTALGTYGVQGWGMRCIKCDKVVHLRTDEGASISLDEMRTAMMVGAKR